MTAVGHHEIAPPFLAISSEMATSLPPELRYASQNLISRCRSQATSASQLPEEMTMNFPWR